MSITSRGLNLEDSAVHGQDGNIKRTTTEIEDDNITLGLFSSIVVPLVVIIGSRIGLLTMKTIRQSGGSRFVDDALHVKAGNASSILGSLPLLIVKVSGDGNNGTIDPAAQMSLGSLPQLRKDHGANLLGT
mmetsp:Transcript_14423/g.31043  ORF Transcript_14423/g.31043 Transcript_14423/m.31043 type:complete len:131 (+) Transcript_14423:1189-1581(+)